MEGKGRITGHTGLLALIGSPVGHSGSPTMYNYSFEKLGLDYAYVAFDIKVEEVKAALDAMRLFHMRGCNVTMPCKTEAATTSPGRNADVSFTTLSFSIGFIPTIVHWQKCQSFESLLSSLQYLQCHTHLPQCPALLF